MKKQWQKTILTVTLLGLSTLSLSGSVIASETTGNLSVGVQTGVTGVIKSTPTASPVAGTFHASQSVTLSAPGSSSIHYSTDGTDPTCTTGTTYSSAIAVSATTTIEAVSCYADGSASAVASHAYSLTCSTASVSHGTVAAYPSCVITCSSGYTKSGSSCVTNDGGGGGGGGGYIAPTTPVVTTPVVTPTTTPATTTTTTTTSTTSLSTARAQLLTVLITQLQALLQQAQTMGIALPAGTEQFLVSTPSVKTQAQTSTSGKLSFSVNFSRDLKLGVIGEDVRTLQKALNALGFTIAGSGPGSPGNETTKFGAFTQAALAKFQAAKGITPSSGYLGAKTRAFIESLSQ